VLTAGVAVLGTGTSGAQQQQDPYSSSTTSTQAPRPRLRIVISIHIGAPGARIRIQVCCVQSGQPITVTLGGNVVLSDTARPGVGVALAARSRPIAAINPQSVLRALGVNVGHRVRFAEDAPFDSGIDNFFTVPELSPGQYDICASTPGYPPGCDTFTVTARAGVLGQTFSRGGSGSSGTAGSVSANRNGGGVGALARTGLELLLFLLLAVGLLACGRYLVVVSRRKPHRH
jgi:hypothetical protein